MESEGSCHRLDSGPCRGVIQCKGALLWFDLVIIFWKLRTGVNPRWSIADNVNYDLYAAAARQRTVGLIMRMERRTSYTCKISWTGDPKIEIDILCGLSILILVYACPRMMRFSRYPFFLILHYNQIRYFGVHWIMLYLLNYLKGAYHYY